MKKNIALMLTLLFTGSTLLFTGCKKDEDDVPPVITLIGPAEIVHPEGTTFTDPGATATDDEDGDITSRISKSGAVNVNSIGTYTLSYNVSDRAGNAAAPKSRNVHVTYEGSQLAAQYTYTDACDGVPGAPGFVTITTVPGEDFQVRINDIFAPGMVVTAHLKGNTITIPQQSTQSVNIQGSGTMNTAGTIWNISFTVDDLTGNPLSCTAQIGS